MFLYKVLFTVPNTWCCPEIYLVILGTLTGIKYGIALNENPLPGYSFLLSEIIFPEKIISE